MLENAVASRLTLFRSAIPGIGIPGFHLSSRPRLKLNNPLDCVIRQIGRQKFHSQSLLGEGWLAPSLTFELQ